VYVVEMDVLRENFSALLKVYGRGKVAVRE